MIRRTAAQLSEHMRTIRKKDTRPEIAVRRIVHALGYRFRLHRRDLPGTPDIVLPRHRKVILVHGCFWHQHANCRLSKLPRSRTSYWLPKLARNVQRDETALTALRQMGWKACVIWECEVADQGRLLKRLNRFLRS